MHNVFGLCVRWLLKLQMLNLKTKLDMRTNDELKNETANDAKPVLPAVFSQPTDEQSGRFLCNAAHPMPQQRPSNSRWTHPDAKEIGEDYGKGGGVADGDYVQYRCPHCQHKWWVELPN